MLIFLAMAFFWAAVAAFNVAVFASQHEVFNLGISIFAGLGVFIWLALFLKD